MEFSTLSLNESGKRSSALHLVNGMAYVNWLGKDDFSLTFAQEKIALGQAVHFRVDASSQVASVAVFKGDLSVEGPSGTVAVAKKKTASFDETNNDKFTLASNIQGEPLDSWDNEAIQYHQQYAKNNDNVSPYGYGLSDLNYYGSFSSVPGYGLMWQPFFTGVGWDPFMDGAWGWYPGFGYMFASAYPWGWLPYRYGNWIFVPAAGWMWQPGGWNSWLATPRFTATSLAAVHPLVAPSGTVKTVFVGKGETASSKLATSVKVNAGSAGLGIARGSLDNLGHLNRQVAKAGFVEVHPEAQFEASSPRGFSGFKGPEGTNSAASSAGHTSSTAHAASGGAATHH